MDHHRPYTQQETREMARRQFEDARDSRSLSRHQATHLVRSPSGNLRLGKSDNPTLEDDPQDADYTVVNYLRFLQRRAQVIRIGKPCCTAPNIEIIGHVEGCFTCGSIMRRGSTPTSSGKVSKIDLPRGDAIPPVDHDAVAGASNLPPRLHRGGLSRPSFPHSNGSNALSSSQTLLPFAVYADSEELQQTDSPSADNNTSTPVVFGPMTRTEFRRAQRAAARSIAQEIPTWGQLDVTDDVTNSLKPAGTFELPRRLQAAIDKYRPAPIPPAPITPVQELPECSVCQQRHAPTDVCLICTECAKTGHETGSPYCRGPAPKFWHFEALPTELRKRIYAYALMIPNAILPHLCDKELKFHDDNARGDHGSVSSMLGVTRVSKKIHAESLPVFYAVNTFAVGTDTATYFDRLVTLGRFHLLRNVQFDIRKRQAETAAITLRSMTQYLAEASTYETQLAIQYRVDPASPRAVAALVGLRHSMLVNHPQYTTGGLMELLPFICLQKLCSPSPLTGTPTLVLPVPHASLFADEDGLSWFPTVCFGLGVSLQFVVKQHITNVESESDSNSNSEPDNNDTNDANNDADKDNCYIRIVWRQKYQKKDFEEEDVKEAGEREEVYKRTIAMFPTLETMNRPRVNAYMRFGCDGHFREWRDVQTVGGGIS